jgi:hypothetical protein
MSLNPKIIRTKFNAILEALSIKFGKYRDFQVVLSDGRRVYGRAEFDEKTVDIAIDDELIHEPKVKMDGRWASLSE